ncbi:hypothetical protein DFJ73DRAFT_760300 [Zopfochytrium polystomum]|nr:hypothetical protein DFJ73DRAFT_760300 [Zopfochytrium polystomum]
MPFALNPIHGALLWSTCLGFQCERQLVLSTMRSSPLYRPRNYDPSSPWPFSPPTSVEGKKGGARDCFTPLVWLQSRRSAPFADRSTDWRLESFRFPFTLGPFQTALIPMPTRGLVMVARFNTLVCWNPTTGEASWKVKIQTQDYNLPSILIGAGAPPLPLVKKQRDDPKPPADGLPGIFPATRGEWRTLLAGDRR